MYPDRDTLNNVSRSGYIAARDQSMVESGVTEGGKNTARSASYPDVSLWMKMCAQRKAGRRQRARLLRLLSVPFPWSLAVHHQSLAFRARLCHAKNEAPEEEAAARSSQFSFS